MEKSEIDVRRKARMNLFIAAIIILLIVTLLSAILLTVRLADYIKQDDKAVSLRSSMDDKLNVFSVEYLNSTGEISVKGEDDMKIIAPGTDIEYTLRLRNVDDVAIDYTFVPVLRFTSKYTLPIEIRLLDPEDKYVIGNETTWVPIDKVGNVSGNGTLAVNETAEYVFQWRWPFESGDDAYDSFLGSAEIEGGIGVELSFSLHSEANLSVDANGGPQKAPLMMVIRTLILVFLLICAIILLILYIVKRIKANLEEKPDVVEIIKTVEVRVEVPVAGAPVPEEPKKRLGFMGKMAYINIDTLDDNFRYGERINIKILKERGLIPRNAKQIKILSRMSKPLEKVLIVETQGISKEAEIAIRRAGGQVIICEPETGDKGH